MFTLSPKTVLALQTIEKRGYAALSAACVEAAAADATVRQLADEVRRVSFLTCGQAVLAAGLKSAKSGGDNVAVCHAMADMAADVAAKAKAKADAGKAKADAGKLAKLETELAAMTLALKGTAVEKALAKLADARAAADAADAVLAKAKFDAGNAAAAVTLAEKELADAQAADAQAADAAAPAAEQVA